jgi:hypothetical protein
MWTGRWRRRSARATFVVSPSNFLLPVRRQFEEDVWLRRARIDVRANRPKIGTRQHRADQTEELAIGADTDRRLRDREGNKLRITGQWRSTSPAHGSDTRRRRRTLQRQWLPDPSSRAPISSEHKDWKLRLRAAGPCRPADVHVNPLNDCPCAGESRVREDRVCCLHVLAQSPLKRVDVNVACGCDSGALENR